MKPGDLEYQNLVEQKRAEIRGNKVSVKMTPEECREEILKATEGVIDTDREARLALSKVGINALIDEATGYQEVRPTDDLRSMIQPKKRGRPKGSKNRPKPTNGEK